MTSYSAKTIEEILEQAAEEKGCSVEDLSYTILEEKDGVNLLQRMYFQWKM